MDKVIYPELSFRLTGLAFKVFNDIGYGMSEKYYQDAFAVLLEKERIPFKKEQLIRLFYEGEPMGRYFLDFVIDDKIIIELKTRPRLGYVHIKQVTGYLKTLGCKLAILVYFTKDGVKFRRILNAQ